MRWLGKVDPGLAGVKGSSDGWVLGRIREGRVLNQSWPWEADQQVARWYQADIRRQRPVDARGVARAERLNLSHASC